jgi:hypothetical protein
MTYQLYPAAYVPNNKRPPTLHQDGTRIRVALDYPDLERQIGSNAWSLVDEHGLTPSPLAIELYRLALLAYTADTRIPRILSFNSWERDLVLHVPVADPAPWLATRALVLELLSFLTGDHWQLEFYASKRPRPPQDLRARRRGRKPATDTVSLFSGGLDSLIGASDLLAAGTQAVLIGHCDAPSTSSVQSTLLEALEAKYGSGGPLLQFWIRPPHLVGNAKETTTRGRSFLFFALATLVASGLGRAARLVIPENGFIAVNAPLTGTRLGPLSTRTVHPYTVVLYRRLLDALGLPVRVETPYALATKGEMLERAADQAFLRSCGQLSMSCAHPTAGRWKKLSAFKHCGRCVPCLIRRASFHRVGWDAASAYHTDVLTVGRNASNLEDLRAFLVAIERRHTVAPELAVMRSGPIPAEAGSVAQFANVYARGLDEVAAFLRGRKHRRL